MLYGTCTLERYAYTPTRLAFHSLLMRTPSTSCSVVSLTISCGLRYDVDIGNISELKFNPSKLIRVVTVSAELIDVIDDMLMHREDKSHFILTNEDTQMFTFYCFACFYVLLLYSFLLCL